MLSVSIRVLGVGLFRSQVRYIGRHFEGFTRAKAVQLGLFDNGLQRMFVFDLSAWEVKKGLPYSQQGVPLRSKAGMELLKV